VQTLSGGSYGFAGPTGIAVDGGHIWVSNAAASVAHGGSVTELDASTGRWMRTLSGGSYGFNRPNAIAVGDGDIWVASITGYSVTELDASTGHWVRTLTLGAGDLTPVALAVDGPDVWVLNGDNGVGAGSVTELDASTARLVRTLRGKGYSTPSAIAVDGRSLWVASLSYKENAKGSSATAVPTLTQVRAG
jgi:outer membrane protein assembly factor BamB